MHVMVVAQRDRQADRQTEDSKTERLTDKTNIMGCILSSKLSLVFVLVIESQSGWMCMHLEHLSWGRRSWG